MKFESSSQKTTGINMPTDMWELLNRVAFGRAKKHGGRPSVSALLVGLVERHRDELERELKGYEAQSTGRGSSRPRE
jgi:hypothetical protein